MASPRICAWCRGPIPEGARSDALTCSQSCRQARHRFERVIKARARAAKPLKLAYADPPYPGLAYLYRGHPDYRGEVDYRQLLARLKDYDGWALSLSSAALPEILALALELGHLPRVGAWFRGPRKVASSRPLQSWEPVIYIQARPMDRADPPLDSLVYTARARTTDPARVIGAKPAHYCAWILELLGARPGDRLDDLYPGSGGMGRAFARLESLAR